MYVADRHKPGATIVYCVHQVSGIATLVAPRFVQTTRAQDRSIEFLINEVVDPGKSMEVVLAVMVLDNAYNVVFLDNCNTTALVGQRNAEIGICGPLLLAPCLS
jgi:hypothetical protein